MENYAYSAGVDMTQEALKLALEAFHQIFNTTPVYHNDGTCIINDKSVELSNKAIAAIKEALAQEQEPVAHPVIAGALFDFMGWLTSRKERIVLSSADNASPAADAIRDFANMRGLSLDDAKVLDWNTTPPQRTWIGLTDEEHNKLAVDWGCLSADWILYAAAVERAVKEKNT